MPTKNIYVCSKCDAQFAKWSGRCLECGSWGSLALQTISDIDEKKEKIKNIAPANLIDLRDIKKEESKRIKTNMVEADRVFGGGIVPGSIILLGGEPGIGKSTIVAQIADIVSNVEKDKGVLYASGEESASQVKSRLERLNCNMDSIRFVNETNIEKIASSIVGAKPNLAIIDSIQTVYSHNTPSEAGSVSQIRASTASLLETAKNNNIAIIVIGHVTKDGQVAGPKTLEHMVDTVIYLETEKNSNYRIMRSTKNRFGSVNEIGIFEMTGQGFKEVNNPSAIFLGEQGSNISGSALGCVMEGTRPFLVEIQALVTKTVFGYPQRKASGFDLNRLQVLTSVLTKRTKVNLATQDVILNIVGGLKIDDTGLDLAVCTAISSSMNNQALDRETLIIGEVGLGGEVRNVSMLEQRLKEAQKLGFKKAIIPNTPVKVDGLEIKKIKNISEILS